MKIARDLTIIVALILTIATTVSAQQSKIEAQKKFIANLERSIAREEKELIKLKANKASIEEQVRSLVKQIERRNDLIHETSQQIDNLTAEVRASEKRLRDLKGQQMKLEENVKKLARAAYRNYRYQNHLAFLFSSSSFGEMAQRVAMLRAATEHRFRQIEQIIEVRKNVEAERDLLAKRKDELSVVKRRLDSQRKKLKADMETAKENISKLSEKQKAVLRSNTENKEKLDAAIKYLRKLVKGNKAGASFSLSTTALNLPVIGGKVKLYKDNMAEVIGEKDAGVTVIYEGKVVQIKRNKVNNKYDVFVAHGEFITSYANLSSVMVEEGDLVRRDQQIGVIGTAVNIMTMESEYRVVFGIYGPSADIKMDARECFEK